MAINTSPSFGNNTGIVTDSSGNYTFSDFAHGLAIHTDGKIIVAGEGSNQSGTVDFAVIRYNPDGSLDTTFGNGGLVVTDMFGGLDYANDVAVQSDGKILVAGTVNGSQAIGVLRYNQDGSEDTTFGNEGKVVIDNWVNTSGGNYSEYGQSISIQPDGRIVIGGYALYDTDDIFVRHRLNIDGSIDVTFNRTTYRFVGTDEKAFDMVMQSNGDFFLIGESYRDGAAKFLIEKYKNDGSLVGGFNEDLTLVYPDQPDIHLDHTATAGAIQSNGKLVVVGNTDYLKGGAKVLVVRYNSDGSLDTTFDSDGYFLGLGGVPKAVAVQADGKIVVAGIKYNGSSNDLFVARFNANGSLDNSFDGDGSVIIPIKVFDSSVVSRNGFELALQTDGKIVVSVNSDTGNPDYYDFTTLRFNTDGSLDSTFGYIPTVNNTASYTENGAAVVLDNDAQVIDQELMAANYAGASLQLSRQGGANEDDLFSGAGITAGSASGTVTVSGANIGSYSFVGGLLSIQFNSSATQPLVNLAMQSLAYSNASDAPDSSVTLEWIFNDGNSGLQGEGGPLTATATSTVTIKLLNVNTSEINNREERDNCGI